MIEAMPSGATSVDEAPADWLEQVERYLESPEARWEALGAESDDDPADLLSRIENAEALLTQLQLDQARDIARLRAHRLREQVRAHGVGADPQRLDDDGWVASEVGWALGLSETQVRRRLDWVDGLDRYRCARALVARGRVPAWTAHRLVEHLDEIAPLVDADALAAIERATVAWLDERPRPVASLNRRMRRLLLRLRAHAGLSEDSSGRHADRRVQVTSRGDGTAEVWALLPEADALAVLASLDDATRSRLVDDDPRTRDQRRADALVARVTGRLGLYGLAGDEGARRDGPAPATVSLEVTIPLDTLGGRGDGPAEVAGYGPVPASTARDLVECTSGRAHGLLYDPGTGRLIGLTGSVDLGPVRWLADAAASTGYGHSPVTERLLRARDRTCRAPGCARPARRCDCDHVVPWPDGPTSVANGCCLCRHHHRLKTHAAGWTVQQQPDGDLTWTAPSGRRYATSPHEYSDP